MIKKTTAWIDHQRYAAGPNHEGQTGTAYSVTPQEEKAANERLDRLWETVHEITRMPVARIRKPPGFL